MSGLLVHFQEKFVMSVVVVDTLTKNMFTGRAKIAEPSYFAEILGSKFVEVGD